MILIKFVKTKLINTEEKFVEANVNFILKKMQL